MALASTSARGSFDGPLLASSESASHSCSASSASIGPIRSRGLYAILYVVRLLAGPELDDAEVREAVLVEGVFLNDGFDLLPGFADCQDDASVAGYLSAGDEKIAGRVVLLEETDVRGHVRVNFLEGGFVDELDDEHNRQPAAK